MNMPSVVHPKVFKLNDILFEVVSYETVTDKQAENIVRLFCRSKKFHKKDKGKKIQIITQFDKNSSNLLS